MEGEGASTRANRWIDLLIGSLRTGYSVGGAGFGLTSRYFGTYLTESDSWRHPGSTTGTVANASYFYTQADRGSELASTASLSWAVTGDSFDLVYTTTGGAGGYGSIKVYVDGTLKTTIASNSVAYQPGTIYHGSLGTAGAHTIKVVASSGTVAVDGVVVYNGDYTAGITYWDCTHTGYDNNNFEASGLDYQEGWGQYLPHLIIDDEVGGNEFLNSTLSPTDMAALLHNRIVVYKALSSAPSILFVVNWDLPGLTGNNTLGYSYTQYMTAAINQINTDGGCVILDVRTVYPTAASNRTWFASDNLHPSDLGHGKIADAVDAVLTP